MLFSVVAIHTTKAIIATAVASAAAVGAFLFRLIRAHRGEKEERK